MFQDGPPGQGSKVSANTQQAILVQRRGQGEQRPDAQHSVIEPGRVYTKGVQGSPRGAAIDAPSGVPFRAGL